MTRPDYWLAKFSKLRVDRARGDPAPHKPLLLLVMCDFAESGDLREVVSLSPELAFRFCTYWSIVAARRSQRPDVRLPFHFLSGEGYGACSTSTLSPPQIKNSQGIARLPSDLVAFLEDPTNREEARHISLSPSISARQNEWLYMK